VRDIGTFFVNASAFRAHDIDDKMLGTLLLCNSQFPTGRAISFRGGIRSTGTDVAPKKVTGQSPALRTADAGRPAAYPPHVYFS